MAKAAFAKIHFASEQNVRLRLMFRMSEGSGVNYEKFVNMVNIVWGAISIC